MRKSEDNKTFALNSFPFKKENEISKDQFLKIHSNDQKNKKVFINVDSSKFIFFDVFHFQLLSPKLVMRQQFLTQRRGLFSNYSFSDVYRLTPRIFKLNSIFVKNELFKIPVQKHDIPRPHHLFHFDKSNDSQLEDLLMKQPFELIFIHQAFDYFKKAANHGLIEAIWRISACYCSPHLFNDGKQALAYAQKSKKYNSIDGTFWFVKSSRLTVEEEKLRYRELSDKNYIPAKWELAQLLYGDFFSSKSQKERSNLMNEILQSGDGYFTLLYARNQVLDSFGKYCHLALSQHCCECSLFIAKKDTYTKR